MTACPLQVKMIGLSDVREINPNRIHFTNSYRYQAGTYSCAMDCFLPGEGGGGVGNCQ